MPPIRCRGSRPKSKIDASRSSGGGTEAGRKVWKTHCHVPALSAFRSDRVFAPSPSVESTSRASVRNGISPPERRLRDPPPGTRFGIGSRSVRSQTSLANPHFSLPPVTKKNELYHPLSPPTHCPHPIQQKRFLDKPMRTKKQNRQATYRPALFKIYLNIYTHARWAVIGLAKLG